MKIKETSAKKSAKRVKESATVRNGGPCVACWAVRIERLRTHGVAGRKGWSRGGQDRRAKGLAFAVLLRFKKKKYRIRYYLSSEKLKVVD